MGVFTRVWMDLLVAGGMEYHRARSLTGELSQVISESRSAITKKNKMRARGARGCRKTEGRKRGTEKGGEGVVGCIETVGL
jgi:hypothetical protein